MNNADVGFSSERVWPVGVLCKAIAGYLDEGFNPIKVIGEIAGFTKASSGHCYFTLKDATGQLRCAFFRRAASNLDFVPSDGVLVEASGRLGVYEARGELQLVVESLTQAGKGNLFERFLKIKASLEGEGLFSPTRKRGLPRMPRGIGVVASLGSAALHDVATTLQRRVPHIPVLVSASTVQGDGAAQELQQALERLYALARGTSQPVPFFLDVILLVRGGGALEDLWAFNDEQLARTIAASPVPVVCGVGHETDFTIADFVSDVRAPTPTAAAELVSESAVTALRACEALESRLEKLCASYIDRQFQHLDLLWSRIMRPSSVLAQQKMNWRVLSQRMQKAGIHLVNEHVRSHQQMVQELSPLLRLCLQRESVRVDQAKIRLGLLDPSLVLKRGYAMLTSGSGRAVCSVTELEQGERVQATLADGTVDLEVLSRTAN